MDDYEMDDFGNAISAWLTVTIGWGSLGTYGYCADAGLFTVLEASEVVA